MRLLLDTQVALWWLVGSSRLNRVSRDLIVTSSCVVSAASIWEVAIKHRLGKLPIPPQLFRDHMQNAGATLLPIADVHAIATTEVPVGHHDPFDRLLLATAQIEHLVLLTGDEGLLRLGRLEPTLPVKAAR
ncbi:MAG: type II toxin-antitoxin system VapC family toxin [Gammaproteobacteria bacterium]